MSIIPRPNPAGRFDPERLFRPNGVAVIGAETETGARVLANLMMGGFHGAVHATTDAASLTQPVDLAFIATEPARAVPTMAALAAKGCFAAVVLDGADDLREAARRTGVRVLGPHSFGLAIPAIGLNGTLSHLIPPPGRLALVSQSAGLARAVIDWAGGSGVGFSTVAGIGGNADIGHGLVLDWLSREPGTGAILLVIRRLRDRRAFLSAARAAARLRPVVALHDGLRHDGTPDLVFEAALRRAGVLSVARLEDLLAAAETLSRARPLRRDSLAVVTNATGPGSLASQAMARAGLAGAVVYRVDTADLAVRAEALARADQVGGVMVVHAPAGADDTAAAHALAALAKARPPLRLPVLVCAMGETTGGEHRRVLAAAGLPVFATPDQAVRGFVHLVQDRRNRAAARELPPSAVLNLAPARADVQRVFDRVRALGRLTLAQDEALEVLSAYGIPSVPIRFAAGPGDAAAAADLLGYPAAVKLRQWDPPAARRTAGLALDLHDAASVAAAARRMAGEAGPGPEAGLVVQRQVARARELAIRVRDDPIFGPAIVFGAGGTAADPMDIAIDLPPLNLSLAHALIAHSRVGARLGEQLRDRPAGNVAAVAEALVRVSQLAVDFPEIAELDIPALFADPRGVLAADAWIALRPAGDPPARLAIAPYPAELTCRFSAGDEMLTLRPIRPEDATAHGGFFHRLSPQDIRFRFFSAMKELSPEMTARLTQIDYEREMAFVAVREETNETVGVARLARDTYGPGGEFAVIVQADMKGKGLAGRLMQCLIDWARAQGMAEIVGQVLADNVPMLAFVRRLGFTVRRMPSDPEVMEARLPLD